MRLLIPFVSGILFCRAFKVNSDVVYPLVAVFLTLVLLFYLNTMHNGRRKSRIYLFANDIFLFLSAILAVYFTNPLNKQDYVGYSINNEKQEWVGEVLEIPVEKENFYKTVLEVKSIRCNNSDKISNGKVLAYFRKPIKKQCIQPGNLIIVNSTFILPAEPLNPEEFNYKHFLELKGIRYQTFVDVDAYKLNSTTSAFSLQLLGLKIKSKIINVFNSGELNISAGQLCTALLTGYDDDINNKTINAFAHSGTLHVLSVSGLHTGLVFALIAFVLGLIDKHKKHKIIHLVILLIGLWLFAMVTGFSPPVMRAAVMLSFIAVGKYYYNYIENATLNILAVSAFFILLFRPNLVFDVGFLLSYSAVLGILLFSPGITRLFNSKYKLVNKLWELSAVSISAQLSTLPITLYFFHQFPIWFILSNIVIIPLCTLLMVLGFAYLFKLSFLTYIINGLSMVITELVHLTDVPNYGYLDKIDFNRIDVTVLVALIILGSLFVKYRTFNLAMSFLLCVVMWQVFSFADVFDKKQNSFLSIYHVNKALAFGIKNKTQVLFTSNADSSSYDFHVKNHHATFNYPDFYDIKFDYIKCNGVSLFAMKHPEELSLVNFLKPDYILMTQNVGLEAKLSFNYRPHILVADGSNNYRCLKKLKTLSEELGIPFYSTKESGYFQVNLGQ